MPRSGCFGPSRPKLSDTLSPRSWTDHLLWHHACHTVDLFQYQTGES
ncbi:MAG: hypothetical protein P8X69_06525, partial [Maritimibacter sp.]